MYVYVCWSSLLSWSRVSTLWSCSLLSTSAVNHLHLVIQLAFPAPNEQSALFYLTALSHWLVLVPIKMTRGPDHQVCSVAIATRVEDHLTRKTSLMMRVSFLYSHSPVLLLITFLPKSERARVSHSKLKGFAIPENRDTQRWWQERLWWKNQEGGNKGGERHRQVILVTASRQ